jgi:hypothetical protein
MVRSRKRCTRRSRVPAQHCKNRDDNGDTDSSLAGKHFRPGSSIRGPSYNRTDADVRYSPSWASCTASSRTRRSGNPVRSRSPSIDRIRSRRRPDMRLPYRRRVRTIHCNLRSSHQAAARVSASSCDTSPSRLHHKDRHRPGHRLGHNLVPISGPSSGSRWRTTMLARAREACVSSFPPNDQIHRRTRRRERVRARRNGRYNWYRRHNRQNPTKEG